MTAAGHFVVARRNAFSAAVMMADSVCAANSRSAGKVPRETVVRGGIVDADTGCVRSTVHILITRPRTGSLGGPGGRTNRSRIGVAVRLTLTGLANAEVVDRFARERTAGLVPSGNPRHAGARQTDTQLVLSDHADEGRRVIKVEVGVVALAVGPAALGAATLLAGHDPLHADGLFVPAVSMSLTLRSHPEVVVWDVVAGKHHAELLNENRVPVVERHGRTRNLGGDVLGRQFITWLDLVSRTARQRQSDQPQKKDDANEGLGGCSHGTNIGDSRGVGRTTLLISAAGYTPAVLLPSPPVHLGLRQLPAGLLLALLIGPLLGCGEPEPGPPPPLPDDFLVSGEIVCDAPVSGLARLSEEGAERGLLPGSAPHEFAQSQVVAQDLDGDGDIDLLYPIAGSGVLTVFRNDGEGFFEVGSQLPYPPGVPPTGTAAAVDLTGDGLPEVILASSPQFFVFPNQGDGNFGSAYELYNEAQGGERFRYPSFAFGDADGDGDLDLAGFAHEPADSNPDDQDPEDGPLDFEGSRDVLMLLEAGALEETLLLESVGTGTLGLVGTFTDRDHDGDQDLLIPSDRDLTIAFWRNDGNDSGGVPQLTDDAADIHADVLMDGMGVDSADLNGDGLLDYCITDTGDPVCLVSDGSGGYIEMGTAMGLSPVDPPLDSISTIGWSIDFTDLENDGVPEVIQSSGPLFDGPGGEVVWPDLLWEMDGSGQFVDRSAGVGFDSLGNHFALASADFNADGFLDVILTGPGTTPLLHMNSCGDNAWLAIELIGPPGNQEGFGARAEVTGSGGTQIRELYNLRGMGQGPSRFQFGLGSDDEAERVRIEWPDGAVSEAERVPTRRFMRVTHPSLL